MSLFSYLPAVLAGAGIALRFWLSRASAPTVTASIPSAAEPVPAVTTAQRSATPPAVQRPELALA